MLKKHLLLYLSGKGQLETSSVKRNKFHFQAIVQKILIFLVAFVQGENDEDIYEAYLYAFDFDHTIVDQNSDSAVMEIIHDPVPENLQRMYDGTNWSEYMDKIFRFVADEGGTYEVIASKIALLRPTDGKVETVDVNSL